jgi:NAD(P)-dependent dehydrogenase (short-subunit alcohol dehydrogenase family)
MDLGLQGKVALVTGAGSQRGFGKGIALTLAREGCDIIAADRDFESVKLTVAQIEALGRGAIASKTDVSISAEVTQMVSAALARFGRIDILVNNAGVGSTPKPFIEKTETDWDNDININLKGVLYCTKAVLGHMLSRKSGKIINIASGAGLTGLAGRSTYSAAKGGVIAFTKALAKEVGSSGINVNCLTPGIGETNFALNTNAPPEFMRKVVATIPMGRAATPQDVANAVAYFVSDAACYIQGQTLNVNGGLSM